MSDVLDLVPHNIPEHLPKMKDLYEDLFEGGKGYRAALVLSVSQALGLSSDDAAVLARCIEFIHNSSLLHDDLVDQAPLRRGKPAAWKKYSSGYAILAGDYLLARVMKELSEKKALDLIHYTSVTILDLVEGEWLQDATLKRTDVTEDEIREIHLKKTSSLFSWCFKAPTLLLAGVPDKVRTELYEIGQLFGLLLQRSDDLLDLDIRNYENKTFFTDIKSGYFNSFMVKLLENCSEEQKEKVFSCESIGSLIRDFSLDLGSTLETYDSESRLIQDKLSNLIKECSVFSSDFKNELLEGAQKIYWRKSDAQADDAGALADSSVIKE